MTVYRCEDSLESIFTAIYQAYEEKRKPEETMLALTDEPFLFAQDLAVLPCEEKVRKVVNTLKRRFGEGDYMTLCMALSSEDEEKAQAAYRTVADGLSRNCGQGRLFDNLANDWVHKSFAQARRASREICHMKEFLRFEELQNGILYAVIAPKCNAVSFIMPHFADRLPIENFVIYDEGRKLFGIHPAGRSWYLLWGEEAEKASEPSLSEEEEKYQELFRVFCRTIAIEGRKNPKLQRNLLPLKYREYMVEFREHGVRGK